MPQSHSKNNVTRAVQRTGRGVVCAMAVLVATVFVASDSALAQLSADDIAALKARGVKEGWTFEINDNPATTYSLDQLCGFSLPDDWEEDARFKVFEPVRDVPSSFDWRALGGTTPVKNQGGCGSCWAFSTVAPLECNILIKDGVVVDLSEQWLLSCNQSGWDCEGGQYAHDYHWDAHRSMRGFGGGARGGLPL